MLTCKNCRLGAEIIALPLTSCVSWCNSFCQTQSPHLQKAGFGSLSLWSLPAWRFHEQLWSPVDINGERTKDSIIWPSYWSWYFFLVPSQGNLKQGAKEQGLGLVEALTKDFTFPWRFPQGLWIGARTGGSYREMAISKAWWGGTCRVRYWLCPPLV